MSQRYSVLSRLALFLWFFLAGYSTAAPSDFPVPENIKPAINFWVRVYTEVDTRSGFLHDPVSMSVVYARVERDTSVINRTRDSIRADLRVLASGKRTGLTAEQQRILDLWPQGTSNARFAEAADAIRWQLGQSDRFREGLQRSGAYREHIEEVVRSKGMPIELAVLPHVESSFHPGAYSSAAATGMWQFVRATAQRFMQVDYVVDQRLDPFDATYGAMDLLQYNYTALGTWPLALTAYNHGSNGMARAVSQLNTTDIGRIVSDYKGRSFGFASRNFYAQFLAVLEVESRENELFGEVTKDSRPDFVTAEIPDFVDARVLADTLGVNINSLRVTNPALQPSVWSGTKRIPRGFVMKINRAEMQGDAVAALGRIALSERHSAQIPDKSYVVQRGDSLSVIASRYNITVSELVAINQLRDRNSIRIGQNLLLPQQEAPVAVLAVASSLSEPLAIPANGLYDVRQGDTLSIIAARFRVSEANLMSLNSLGDRNLIFPGQTLRLNPQARQIAVAVAVAEPELREPILDEPVVDVPVLIEPDVAGNAGSAPRQQPAVAETIRAIEDSVDEIVLAEESPIDTDEPAVEVSDLVLAVEEEQQLLTDLSADPADYTVDMRSTIEIQATETLGHYADWLEIRASDLRRLNNMSFGTPVIIGQRLRLSFDEVSREEFELRRLAHHRDLQQSYFAKWHIKGTETYAIKSGDVVSKLADNRDVPFWLFRQYNPAADTNRISIGQQIIFPVVEAVNR